MFFLQLLLYFQVSVYELNLYSMTDIQQLTILHFQMLSTELKPNMQKPTTSGNWLEVSIDSTLPASPVGISKNVFDLSHLDTDLPEWKPATMTTHSSECQHLKLLPALTYNNVL